MKTKLPPFRLRDVPGFIGACLGALVVFAVWVLEPFLQHLIAIDDDEQTT